MHVSIFTLFYCHMATANVFKLYKTTKTNFIRFNVDQFQSSITVDEACHNPVKSQLEVFEF